MKIFLNKKIDLSDDEWEYLQQLRNEFGDDICRDLFKTNKDGRITSVTPQLNVEIPQIILFFFLNVMLNQRLRMIDDGVSQIQLLQERIEKLEKSIL